MARDSVGAFVQEFRAAAVQAGAVARHLQGEVSDRGKPDQHSPESAALSAADLAAQDVLLLRLAERFAHVAMDAEEQTESVARFAPAAPHRPLIVVDPIDGTYNYLHGARDYAVMGAWIEGGRYLASVIHFPAAGATYWAVAGGGCHREREGRVERVTIAALAPRVMVTPSAPAPWHASLRGAGYDVAVSRCSAVDASAPALGRAAGALNPDAADRRRAIGFLLVAEAGGVVAFESAHWRGEDPAGGRLANGVHAIADSPERAARLLAAVR